MKDVLIALRAQFPDLQVQGEGKLEPEMCTGFVWSSRPGTVVLAANRKYFAQAIANAAIGCIVAPTTALEAETGGKLVLVTERADECFYYLHNFLLNAGGRAELPPARVDAEAIVDPTAVLGRGVVIGPGARIGALCVLQGPVLVDRNVTIEPGVVVGCEGLFAKRLAGELVQIRHFGGVYIAESAYVHSGAVLVRSAMYSESTTVGARAHIGVMSNIGHDVQVGEEAVLSSNTVIAGRARIGARAWLGASATVSNAIEVGEGARVNIGAVCIENVGSGMEVSGNFAVKHAKNLKRFLSEKK